jgi:hypothetical protein
LLSYGRPLLDAALLSARRLPCRAAAAISAKTNRDFLRSRNRQHALLISNANRTLHLIRHALSLKTIIHSTVLSQGSTYPLRVQQVSLTPLFVAYLTYASFSLMYVALTALIMLSLASLRTHERKVAYALPLNDKLSHFFCLGITTGVFYLILDE